ncbi:hypothetical protein HGRIS_001630 [Hohenbuehelia grisea]|uniref:Uncharacterized protein n=1 Tax=Hohenbuehelia grisea TaxID=104357 RepID=A0ABR3JJ00_9AGAR
MTGYLLLTATHPMANILTSAKSGSDWTANELLAFNISLVSVPPEEFFETASLPDPRVSSSILNNAFLPDGPTTKSDRLFFKYLKDAMRGEESCVDDFAHFLLSMFDYDEPDRVIHQRKELSFIMHGSVVYAKPDVCVMDDTDFLLLVQEDKRRISTIDAAPQLIAEAIAAFSSNNYRRINSGLAPLQSHVFPGIIMIGTAPIFFRIPITEALLKSVQVGSYPARQTVVQRCFPPVPAPKSFIDEGLQHLGNRRVVLQCLRAFKQFIIAQPD